MNKRTALILTLSVFCAGLCFAQTGSMREDSSTSGSTADSDLTAYVNLKIPITVKGDMNFDVNKVFAPTQKELAG